jgi:hypothetical protein
MTNAQNNHYAVPAQVPTWGAMGLGDPRACPDNTKTFLPRRLNRGRTSSSLHSSTTGGRICQVSSW